ncbi:MAG: branched-chain amino acid transport system II carrier protein [Chlamydiales bacterium]
MESITRKSALWPTSLAIFAMFFGAGNIVFPLALGQFTQDKNFYGVVGLIITSILVPMTGLMAMLLYNGDYTSFFRRIGKIPGFIVTLLILGIIGPFGGIPRCITISYSTLTACNFGPLNWINLFSFALLNGLLIFLFTFRPNKILTLLGYVLTPLLLLSLVIIVVKGLFLMPSADSSMHTRWQTFSEGLLNGYHTMDLLAAFFFSSVVLLCLNKQEAGSDSAAPRFLSVAIAGSLIAATMLATFYVGFSYLASGYSGILESVPGHQMLGALAYELLGPYAGTVASLAVSFACLTTEIALTAIIAEFLSKTLFQEKLSYKSAVLITVFVSFLISLFNFDGITAFLGPILQICYPALIVLSVLNIIYKVYNFRPVKRLFYGTILLTLISRFVLS